MTNSENYTPVSLKFTFLCWVKPISNKRPLKLAPGDDDNKDAYAVYALHVLYTPPVSTSSAELIWFFQKPPQQKPDHCDRENPTSL